ncbi:MAG: glucokinase [Maricaulaceae bacterium]
MAAGAPAAHAPMVGFGPGTGLGLAVLAPLDADRWRVLATEAGHQGFAPGDDLEVEILRFARREHTFVSAEMILSGSGLVMLHRALSAIEGARYHILSAPEITQTGLSHDDPICVRTLEVFCAVMGGFAGDAAVAYGARGGVYVGGGVAQRLATILPHSPFEARFRERGPMSGYVAGVPARLIRSQDAAFAGAAGLFHDTLHEKGSLL